jgi:serine/threonine-protein kinase
MDAYTCPHCEKKFTADGNGDAVIVCPHCNGMVSLPDENLDPGTCLGGFEIVRLLGKGGMGHVYLARQASMNRFVALKVLSRDLTRDRQSVAQFFREMQLTGKLNHPNIVAAIDAGEADDLYFMAMNYVDGEDLEEEMRRFGPLREDEGLRVAARMVDALRYAWEHYGLLHKDIKPGNIMRARGGEVYLMDMGIAQLVNEKARRDDQVVGSPFYMSPEQGRAESLDWRSDCYSLGASLYHLMVGVPPYDHDDVMRIIAMHSTEPFPDPATRRPDIRLHPPTVALLRRMMAKTAEERFPSWQATLAAITEAQATLEAEAEAASPGRRNGAAAGGGKRKGHASRRVRTADPARKASVLPYTRKRMDGRMALLSYALLLGIGVVAALMIVRHRKGRALEHALEQAEIFLAQNPGSLDMAAERFGEVSRQAAGTALAGRAEERHRQVLAEAAILSRDLAHFESEMQRARDLCSRKQYEAAIPVVQGVGNIRDPLKRKEAEMFLIMIRKTIEDRDAGP